MTGKKCQNCGSSDIEVDPARGDAVCTNCGTVLEDNIIVAEIEFQENAHGGHSALGQFVSAESKGGATGFGGAFNVGVGQESREITIRKAKNGITALCQQLRLNQHCIEIACNFFKMALARSLTKGRPASHIHAACTYITCRTEGTPHLLIDISDALGICCYELGRTYLRLSRSLCISIPSMDPCLYILRYAGQLQFGEKKHEVSMTALRLVQRMKRDSIHSGRRPSGLCGAALLIAARLHEFSRTPADVVRIVKVHESTLRKRLLEFGETPSSALTLDEFMSVDLEEDQDPPAFRAARLRDKERLHKLIDEEGGEQELTKLQKEIEVQLERDIAKRKKTVLPTSVTTESIAEDIEAERFALQETIEAMEESLKETIVKPEDKGLGPDLKSMGLSAQVDDKDTFLKPYPKTPLAFKDLARDELVMSQEDESYVDSLIMSDNEISYKTKLWHKINAGYLKEQKIKEEVKAREKEEGKDRKKKLRGNYKKKVPMQAANAGEAIEKMLQEKRMSSKINYEILKTLDSEPATTAISVPPSPQPTTAATGVKRPASSPLLSPHETRPKIIAHTSASPGPAPSSPPPSTPQPDLEEDEDEPETPDNSNRMQSLSAVLDTNTEDDYYDYEEY